MDEDDWLVEKQKAKAAEALPTIKMTPISEVTKTLINKLRPKASEYTPQPSDIPLWPGFKQRRFLIVRGKSRVNVVWVDDDGTCTKDFGKDMRRCHTLDDEGFIERKDWHTYRIISEYKKENLYVFRCPSSLSFEERNRIEFDDPPGHYSARLRAAISDAESGSSSRKAEDEESFA